MSISASRVTRLGISGSVWRPAGDFSGKGVAPVFSGTVPDITGTFGEADVVTDISTYFAGSVDSYSIDPAVETGWTFNTSTGVLTVDTDEANTFGPYTVTATNATGSDSTNAFSVIISEAVATRGASLPPKRVKTKLRKKDESILEEVYKLIAVADEVDPPKQLKERIEKVEVRAKKAINIQPAIQHEKEIRNTKQQIDRIELSLKKYITEVKEDEDAAIRALLEVI